MDALSGEQVEAEVWGVGGGNLVALSGGLRHASHIDMENLPTAFRESEVAETFHIGDGQLILWPSQFIDGERMPNTRGWLELRTKEGVLRVGPKRRPWVD